MKSTLLLLGFVLFLFSCTQHTEKAKEEQPESSSPAMSCYLYANNQDSIWMRLTINENRVSGDLIYMLHEKDRNTGTLTGSMKGDTLLADYKFMSEGVESMREVVFLKSGDTFTEGYGEIEDKDGMMRFKSRTSITFNTTMTLRQLDCPE